MYPLLFITFSVTPLRVFGSIGERFFEAYTQIPVISIVQNAFYWYVKIYSDVSKLLTSAQNAFYWTVKIDSDGSVTLCCKGFEVRFVCTSLLVGFCWCLLVAWRVVLRS